MAGFAVETTSILTADEEIDLVTLVDKQDALAAEARAVLPYSFDECTFARGPLRQSVFSCLDCGAGGVCYGCSISCHAGELSASEDDMGRGETGAVGRECSATFASTLP
jgi:hypothetical protein